ncbi:xylulokinase [Agrobacterium tumefaciens]|nr:xylulokinase [Agrobacterium tumefaciens]
MFLGLDIGTSVIKAATFDGSGRQCADALEWMPVLDAPLGWSELDGDVLWTKVVAVIQKLQRNAYFDCSEIRAIGVTGMMIGAWVIDENGQLLRPPILWNDVRASGIVDSILESDEQLFSKIFSLSGSLMQLGCTLPLVAWIRDNEPTVLDRARHIFCAKDYVRYRLTGEIATDESDAAMAPGSAVNRGFDLEQARLLGVEEFVHLLAPVARAETLAGILTPAAASATGLAIGTPVAVCAGDTASCVLGAGVHRPGKPSRFSARLA